MKNNNSFNPKDWIKIANQDLALAQIIFQDIDEAYSAYACFLCEQAVEKYLKAFLIKHKGKVEQKDKTHRLLYLANQCKKYNLDLQNYQIDLITLTELYTPTRYPGIIKGKLLKEDAKEAIKSAKKVIKHIKVCLK